MDRYEVNLLIFAQINCILFPHVALDSPLNIAMLRFLSQTTQLEDKFRFPYVPLLHDILELAAVECDECYFPASFMIPQQLS